MRKAILNKSQLVKSFLTLVLLVSALANIGCGSAAAQAEIKARKDYVDRFNNQSISRTAGYSVRYETEGEDAGTLQIVIMNWSGTKDAEPIYLNDADQTDARIVKFKKIEVIHSDLHRETINL